MAKVKVTHPGLTSQEAKDAPKREAVPPGRYHAQIMNVREGSTNHAEPLKKVTAEFQILFMIVEADEEAGIEENQDVTHKGRRVYQDYITEPENSSPDLSEQRRWELVQLLDATNAPYDDDGFDTDDLQEKVVIITVRHREGTKTDDDGKKRVFTNVTKVDTAEAIGDDDLV
jgi:hypothetical protein